MKYIKMQLIHYRLIFELVLQIPVIFSIIDCTNVEHVLAIQELTLEEISLKQLKQQRHSYKFTKPLKQHSVYHKRYIYT